MKTITQVIVDGQIIQTTEADGALWTLTPADFLNLFTAAEQDAIESGTNPAAKAARRSLFTVREVRSDDPQLAQLLSGLVAVGLLTTARRDRIAAGLLPE